MNDENQVLEAVNEKKIVYGIGSDVAFGGDVQICQLPGLDIRLPRYCDCGLGGRFHFSDVRQAFRPAAIRICHFVYLEKASSFLTQGLNRNFFLCSAQESGTGLDVSFLNVSPSGSLPFIMASTISGASRARRIIRVT